MSLKSRHFALALIAIAAVAIAPVAAAYPGSASTTWSTSNWVIGKTQQLDDYWVTGVNIPGIPPKAGRLLTSTSSAQITCTEPYLNCW